MQQANLHEYIVYATAPEQINSPAFYDCVLHIVCLSGRGVLSYNGHDFSLSAGQIAIITHPRHAEFINLSEDFSCEYLAAPERFLHNLLPANNYSIQGGVSLFANPVMNVTVEECAILRDDIANIRRRLPDVGHQFYTEMVGSLLQTMIYDLFDFHARRNTNVLTTDRVGCVTSQFFTLIEAGRPKTHRDVSHYAAQLNVSPKYLSDTIKRVTGESVTVHINRAAANIIIRYLRDDRLSVSQIADEMGFASLSYFSRYCTKHIGMSPARFRTVGTKKHE